jgi:HEPN domain-containing protein
MVPCEIESPLHQLREHDVDVRPFHPALNSADLRHARRSLEIGDYNWACFAAQQAAEKALKSYILHVEGEFVRGHDLLALYRRAAKAGGITLKEASLSRLSVYYTVARCPNAGMERPSIGITKEQAEEAVATAEGVIFEVEKALGDP